MVGLKDRHPESPDRDLTRRSKLARLLDISMAGVLPMLKTQFEQLFGMVVLAALLALQAACSPLAVSISKNGSRKDTGSSGSSSSSVPSNVLNTTTLAVTYRIIGYTAPERDFSDPRMSQSIVTELSKSQIEDLISGDYIEFDIPVQDYKPKFTAVFEVTLTPEDIKELGLNESSIIQLSRLGEKSVMMKTDSKISEKKLAALMHNTRSVRLYAECAD